MAELIWVKPGNDDGRVALFETHKDHPDGEVFVAGPPVAVALTPLVERKLKSGELVEVKAPTAIKAPPPRKTKAEIEAEIRAAGGKPSADKSAPPAPATDKP